MQAMERRARRKERGSGERTQPVSTGRAAEVTGADPALSVVDVGAIFAEFRTWPLIRERINNVLRGFAEALNAHTWEQEKKQARKVKCDSLDHL